MGYTAEVSPRKPTASLSQWTKQLRTNRRQFIVVVAAVSKRKAQSKIPKLHIAKKKIVTFRHHPLPVKQRPTRFQSDVSGLRSEEAELSLSDGLTEPSPFPTVPVERRYSWLAEQAVRATVAGIMLL